ncbi:ferredoxin--NADP reductase [Pedobacter xixiisoli]|uniref:Ring-1,2-phenylacetyl-CoA epoxidase subunit PaaE n=1 Tax=Pedobacter xixiisoli TaxID=1476464 RepID=A0A286A834_9SPHI|nr:ferredoxin--NADP reductase [Pedobacter xixiisoli]SOD18076.1 ring-1,2-phenylacetyl-CoA epoxidase subunit PaaE [Pedobacter xixiisoli]
MSLQQLKVTRVQQEVNEVITIILEPLAGEKPVFKAGQFLTLAFHLGNKELRRSYSAYSSPLVDEPLAIAVKLVENGEISRFLHHSLRQGDVVEVTEPNGMFYYDPETDKERTVFLFGAGVGITPLYSILKTALVGEQKSKMVLIYSSRSADETLFLEELKEWQNIYPDRFKLINLFSNSKNLLRARLNGFLVHELIREQLSFNKEDALFYTCGPVDYMDVCRISILGAGYKPHQVKRETFVLPEDEIDEDDATEKVVDKSTYSINLIFQGETHHLQVPWPKRILDVALEHKIKIPYSCSGGVCSTCAATCISGGVRMDYNEVLTDDEIAKGRVLVCTGHPTENETTITWG